MNERKYVAVSIKHSEKNKPPVLWGNRRTEDNEKRSFSHYTTDVKRCELYSLEDFQTEYGNSYIKCDEPVSMKTDYLRRYRLFDTVLVEESDLLLYLKFTDNTAEDNS